MESILELAARTKNPGWNGARRCKRGPELGAIWCLLADPCVAGSMVGGGLGSRFGMSRLNSYSTEVGEEKMQRRSLSN